MFGKNPRRPLVKESRSLWVQEVFRTIQGEGPSAGTPSIFVRLAGCPLQCYFCDTDFESSSWMPTLEELVQYIEEIHTVEPLLVLTGGEPLRQPIGPLVKCLLQRIPSLHIEIETAGIYKPYGLTEFTPEEGSACRIICSPKTGTLHPGIRPFIYAYKYIVSEGNTSEKDGLPIQSTQESGLPQMIARPPKGFPRARIFVQPCDSYNPAQNALNLECAIRVARQHGYRLSIQLHKYLKLP